MRMSMTPRAGANAVPADGSRRDILVGIARGALAGAAVAIGSDVAAQPSPAPLPRVTEAVAPFRVVTSTAAISDARRRLQAARWPERETADGWRQGAPLAAIQSLVAYWRTAYDWRRLERRLNAYPQFRTEIDGLGIHFLHVRSRHEQARPIILTHGWPGSIVEFLNVIGPLTDPTQHGGRPEDAFHVNLPILFPPPLEGEPNQAEKATIAQLVAFNDKKSGYAKIQSTRPQTIGYALADSPAGQAAWIYEKLGEWTDSNYEPEREISRDEMLDNISLYWLTNTAASSARLYYESFATDFSTQRLDLPVAVSIFPGELFLPPRLWGERVYSRLFYWNEAAHGGHFAAFEQPAVFVEELRAAFRALPRGG